MTDFFDLVFNGISDFISTVPDIIKTIATLPSFINEFLSVLPNEIKGLLIPTVLIFTFIFVYRFNKWQYLIYL